MSRTALSTRTRFAIFVRDDFTCQYCGRRAPDVVLEVDHIYPWSLGGTDDSGNLATACKPCNAGKHAMLLPERPSLFLACERCGGGIMAREDGGRVCADCVADEVWGPAYLEWRKRFAGRVAAQRLAA